MEEIVVRNPLYDPWLASDLVTASFMAEVVARLLTEYLPRLEVDDLLPSTSGFRLFASAIRSRWFRAAGNASDTGASAEALVSDHNVDGSSYRFVEELVKVKLL